MNTKKISYKGEKVFIGMDVHREFFMLSAVCKGVTVKRCRISPNGEAVLNFIVKYFPESDIRTCYEAGYSGFWLHRYLVGNGINNIVVNPASVEAESGNRVKTDKIDSLKLAIQLEANRLRSIHIPSEEQENGRLLTRTRDQLMSARTRVRTQIRMKLHLFGLFPVEHKGAINQKLVEKILSENVINNELKVSIQIQLEQWNSLNESLKAIYKQLKEQASKDPYDKLYRSVPGIGFLVARVLSNELGDMSQFPNERALFSFTGLTPGEYSSGNKTRRGHISRRGRSQLRHVLTEAAWKAIRRDPNMQRAYESIATRRGKLRAIVAMARKLVGRARAILKTQNNYVLDYKKAA